MPPPCCTIDGIEVFVEGDGPQAVVMIHGWPDTHRLWDGTVAALQDRYRCVRFTLPGFDRSQPARPLSLADMTRLFAAIVDAVSPAQPVTLLLHDWGCVFGYEFAARHPDRVSRIVAVDIGDHHSADFARSLTAKAKWQIFSYQCWLAIAWMMGRHVNAALGRRMTRAMAHSLRCPTPADAVDWPMNYPYAMRWFNAFGGLRGAGQAERLIDEQLPGLFVYGRRKPFMFHSSRWVRHLNRTTGCAAKSLDTGHWIMKQKPAEFHAVLKDWLANVTQPASTPKA